VDLDPDGPHVGPELHPVPAGVGGRVGRVEGRAAEHPEQDHDRGDQGGADPEDGHPVALAGQTATERLLEDEAEERRGEDDEGEGEQGGLQPLSEVISSTSISSRESKTLRMIARATAASAAATASTKIAKTVPRRG